MDRFLQHFRFLHCEKSPSHSTRLRTMVRQIKPCPRGAWTFWVVPNRGPSGKFRTSGEYCRKNALLPRGVGRPVRLGRGASTFAPRMGVCLLMAGYPPSGECRRSRIGEGGKPSPNRPAPVGGRSLFDANLAPQRYDMLFAAGVMKFRLHVFNAVSCRQSWVCLVKTPLLL